MRTTDIIKSGIYKIINTNNNKIYIGSSINILERINTHKNWLSKNLHPNKKLQNSWNKHQKDSFEFIILEKVPRNRLIEREQYYIDFYNSVNKGYNICLKAGSSLGIKHSKEFCQKISNYHKGRPKSIEHRLNIGKSKKGFKHSEKSRNKMSQAHTGIKLPEERCKNISKGHIGIKHTDRSKLNMSQAKLGENNPMYGRLLTEAHKKRISEANKGRVFSLESRLKISKAKKGRVSHNKGKPMSDEQKIKISLAHKGKVLSKEHKEKLSLAKIGNKNALKTGGKENEK